MAERVGIEAVEAAAPLLRRSEEQQEEEEEEEEEEGQEEEEEEEEGDDVSIMTRGVLLRSSCRRRIWRKDPSQSASRLSLLQTETLSATTTNG